MRPALHWPQRPPEPADLPGADEIHLRQTDLDERVARAEPLWDALSLAEQERARRFVFEEHRRRYVSARTWLRSVLGAYLDLPPRDVPLALNTRGKPHIAADTKRAGLQFNLSHCDRFALLAVAAQREIGIDLQEPLRDGTWPAIAERICTPAEQQHIQTLPPETQARAFVEIWTRKEAAGKATGEGLTARIFSLAVGPAAWGTVDCGGGLSVWSLRFPDRFAAAIAVRKPD